MIEFKIKPCCIKCQTPDLDMETRSIKFGMDDNLTTQILFCNHQCVCKIYLESNQETIDKILN